MIVSNDLFFNIVQDWKKKDITSEEKSVFINSFLVENNLSEREFARRTGIPKSTIHDWVTNRQMKKYYSRKNNEVFYYADRLLYLLSKNRVIDDKSKRKLSDLKILLDSI